MGDQIGKSTLVTCVYKFFLIDRGKSNFDYFLHAFPRKLGLEPNVDSIKFLPKIRLGVLDLLCLKLC